MRKLRFLGALMSTCTLAAAAGISSAAVTNSAFSVGLTASGNYSIAIKGSAWVLDGTLPAGYRVLAPSTGSDRIGPYHLLSARNGAGRVESIRVYDAKPLVQFVDAWQDGGSNGQAFPTFRALPQDAARYSFQVDSFSYYEFNKLGAEGPWILFKPGRAIVLSPADHFKISSMSVAADGSASSGINARIDRLPRGFEHGTLLAAAPATTGGSVIAAMESWGAALQALGGKHAVANDADPVLAKFGYWTDNGAHYYYKYDAKLGYAGTLLAVKDSFAKMGIPLGYIQLDSWFYPKGTPPAWDNGGGDVPHGEDTYRGDPKLFPDGLAAFHKQIGLPFVTHARWVAPTSPYRREFKMSGNVVIDPKFWTETAAYLKDAGVITYEQDWLNANASTAMDVTDTSAFLKNMAASMQQEGLTMQYCMAPPSDYMASSQFQNLTTIRTSDDRFDREKWDMFLYDSEFATILGTQPWVDVFMSPETGNLLIATLSGGPVGVGDALGQTSAENLHAALRGDGLIVKPDVGLHPIERMYAEDAAGKQTPMVAVASSGGSDGAQVKYVFAYPRKESDARASVSLGELGVHGDAVAYDWVKHSAVLIKAGGEVTLPFDGASRDGEGHAHNYDTSPDTDVWNLTVVAPMSAKGIALIGDPAQFATLGRKRVHARSTGGGFEVKLEFAPGEAERVLVGYSEHAPHVSAAAGSAKVSSYNAATKLFSIQAGAGSNGEASFSLE